MADKTLPPVLILPLPPDVSKKEDMERYIRQLHKSLDEWYKYNKIDTDTAVGLAHEHNNKDTLDLITEAFTTALKNAYDEAVNKAHEHSNQSTLDQITEAFTTALKNAYDEAVSKAHDKDKDQYLDYGGSNQVSASDIKNSITDSHTHSNKSILDLITEAFTTALKNYYDTAYSHSQLTSGNPHNVSKSDVGLGNVSNDLQVKASGDQTIYGVKTFDEFPKTPEDEPTDDYEVANKKYVDDNIGSGSGGIIDLVTTATFTSHSGVKNPTYCKDRDITTYAKIGDGEWVKFDFGDSKFIHCITVYGSGLTIQGSNDGSSWTDIYDCGPTKNIIPILNSWRYIRIIHMDIGTARLYEITILGEP